MNPGEIEELVKNMTDFILRYAIALAAIGALSMALVEAVKSMWRSRERYQRSELWKWIEATARDATSDESKFNAEKAWCELIDLTTGNRPSGKPAMRRWYVPGGFNIDYENALFTLDLEHMMGQLQTAADVAVENPTSYPNAYAFLTRGATDDDLKKWRERFNTPVPPGDSQLAKEIAERYTRLNKLVRRRLDSFQQRTGFRWASRNQLWALIFGAVLLFVSIYYLEFFAAGKPFDIAALPRMLIASMLGGVVAPVAKDLVTALKKVRSSG